MVLALYGVESKYYTIVYMFTVCTFLSYGKRSVSAVSNRLSSIDS